MAVTAQAVRPPAHVAAPPVQRSAADRTEQAEAPERLVGSLGAVPAVQRACAGCAGGDDDPDMPVMARRSAEPARVARKCAGCGDRDAEVMPRLEVGPVDDPFEREADDIAGRVMALRDPVPAPVSGGHPGPVRRLCAHCAADEDRPMARRASGRVQRMSGLPAEADPTLDDGDLPRMKPAEGAGAERLAASEAQLSAGGSPMPAATRSFFEARMGRDLSAVRLHRGDEADRLNGSIAARAFTFRNHIWLGPSEGTSPSFTLAHELAHVLQQTAPDPADPAVRRMPKPKPKKPTLAFSGQPYWTSKTLSSKSKNSGTKIHEDLLEQFQVRHNDLFFEAPVPRSLDGPTARSGEADLYKATDAGGIERTVGVNFKGGGTAVKVRFDKAQPHHVPSYSHGSSARPFLRGKSTILGLPEAPTTITMGELKPNLVKKGFGQLNTYEASFRRTQKKSNDLAAAQHADPTTPAPSWPDITFKRLDVTPPSLTGLNGASFGRHELEVRQFAGYGLGSRFAVGNLIHTPPKPVFGELRLKFERDGVYYYWWEPDPATVSTATPPDLVALWPLTSKLFTALRTNRKVVLPRRAADAPAPALRDPGRIRPRVQRRKSGNAKPFPNHFDKTFEATWITHQKKVAGQFKEPTDTDLLTDHYLMEIDSAMDPKDSQGIEQKQKALNSQAYQRVHQYRAIRLISSPFAPLMAKLRRLFGGAFAKGSELYERIKAKFDNRSKPTKSLSGGGILGALLRTAFKVLLLIGRQVVAGTMVQLTEQLKGCLTRMLETWFSTNETVEAVQERVQGARDTLEQEIEAFIGGDPESLSETLFGPYGRQVDTVRSYIEGITKAAGPVLTAYKVVKWGIQALACASPPLVGCLWGLARSAIEWAAGKVIETCWFMKKITPKILKIPQIGDFIRDTSTTLSNGILEMAGSVFPDPVGAFLKDCKSETPKVTMPSSASVCEEGGGDGGMGNDPQPSEEALAFWARWEALPFDKQMALKKMLGLDAAKGAGKADWDKMNAMLDWAEKTDLAEMKKLAEQAAKGDSSAIPGAVSSVKQAAADSVKQGKGGQSDRTAGSDAGQGGAADGGDGRDDTDIAERIGAKPVPGDRATDLTIYAYLPTDLSDPTEGKKLTGDVYISWSQPDGSDRKIVLPTVSMIYRGGLETLEVEGSTYQKWVLQPVKSESFSVRGRAAAFVLSADGRYHLLVPRPKPEKAQP